MILRPALDGDCSAIAALWNPVIRDTTITFTTVEKAREGLTADLAAKSAQGFPFFVAEAEGRLLGFATYGPFRSGPGYARTVEHTIILAPDAWGRGIGRALIASLLTDAGHKGIRAMIGGVSAENAAGIAFHTSLGFAEVGRLPQVGWKFGRFIDLVLMQRLIDPPAP